MKRKHPECLVCHAELPWAPPLEPGVAGCCSRECVATLKHLRAAGPQLPVAPTRLETLPGETVMRLIARELRGPWSVEGRASMWEVVHNGTGERVPYADQEWARAVCERLNAWEATRGL